METSYPARRMPAGTGRGQHLANVIAVILPILPIFLFLKWSSCQAHNTNASSHRDNHSANRWSINAHAHSEATECCLKKGETYNFSTLCFEIINGGKRQQNTYLCPKNIVKLPTHHVTTSSHSITDQFYAIVMLFSQGLRKTVAAGQGFTFQLRLLNGLLWRNLPVWTGVHIFLYEN